MIIFAWNTSKIHIQICLFSLSKSKDLPEKHFRMIPYFVFLINKKSAFRDASLNLPKNYTEQNHANYAEQNLKNKKCPKNTIQFYNTMSCATYKKCYFELVDASKHMLESLENMSQHVQIMKETVSWSCHFELVLLF